MYIYNRNSKNQQKGKATRKPVKTWQKYVYSLNTGKRLVSCGLFWLNVRFKILNLGIFAHLRHIARFWARVGEGKASRGYMVKTPHFLKNEKKSKSKKIKKRKKLRISIVRIIFALHNIRHIRFLSLKLKV